MQSLTAPGLPSPALLPSASQVRDSFRVRFFSIFILTLVACAAVANGWRRGYVLAPTDCLNLFAPWGKAGAEYTGANENLLDQAVQFVPWTIYTVDRYQHGQIPLWNPNSQMGAPFLGNGQSAIFYPTILLHWNLPETWSWTISAALRLFIAGLGVYLLAGRYGLRGAARLLPAIAFMLCGFNVVWLNHPQMNVMPLLPWAVLMTELLVERMALHRVLGAGLVFFVQFLGGHPASCIHLLLVCFLVWFLRVFWEPVGTQETRPASGPAKRVSRALGSGVGLLLAVVLGFGMAAAQWLPLIEYAHFSGAAVVRADRLHSQGLFTFDPRYLIGMVFPYANGYPDGISPFELRQVTHLPNTNELAPAFIGIIPLMLAFFGAITQWRRNAVKLWSILALLAALIAIKFPGIDLLIRRVPALNVAQNARLLVATALGLAILAGFGLQDLTLKLREGLTVPRLARVMKWTAAALMAVALIGALVLLIGKSAILGRGYAAAEVRHTPDAAHEHSLAYVKSVVNRVHTELLLTCARLLIPAMMLGLAVFLLRLKHRGQRGGQMATMTWVWLMLALVDLLAFAIPYNRGAPVETYFPPTPAIEALEQMRPQSQPTPPPRLAGTFRTMIPETSTAYDLPDIRGYDALASKRYYQWWEHPGIGDLADTEQGYLKRLEHPERPAWQLLNFGYLLTAADQPAPPADQFKLVDEKENTRIYQNTKLRPRAWVASKARVFDSIEPVLDRVAKMDFDPDETVLLDKDVAYDQRELADADPSVWKRQAGSRGGTANKPAVSFEKLKDDDDRPETIRMSVSGASGGYLILGDSYFPGWTATVIDGSGAVEVPILPAYGALRAIPLPERSAIGARRGPAGQALTVELQYRPWPWRIGVMISLGSIALFLLLAGLSMLTDRLREEGAV